MQRGWKCALLSAKPTNMSSHVSTCFRQEMRPRRSKRSAVVLRVAEVVDDEADFEGRKPFGGFAVARLVEGLAQGAATVDPRAEAVDGRARGNVGEVGLGQFLFAVGPDGSLVHDREDWGLVMER